MVIGIWQCQPAAPSQTYPGELQSGRRFSSAGREAHAQAKGNGPEEHQDTEAEAARREQECQGSQP
jgi:hypothetical protein